jgi:hypothetical protein
MQENLTGLVAGVDNVSGPGRESDGSNLAKKASGAGQKGFEPLTSRLRADCST